MFKRIPLLCLFLLGSLHGMGQTKKIDVPSTVKQFIFWYINSMPAYQGLIESAEILGEFTIHSAYPADDRVVMHIKNKLKELDLPAADIQVRKQHKPIMAGYKQLYIEVAYYQKLLQSLDCGFTAEQDTELHYHLYRASVYINSCLKPKFIALSLCLPVMTGVTCSYLNQYLPQEGIASWVITLIQACASSAVTVELIQRFLDHMQTEADNAVPNDPVILQAGIQYLRGHSDQEHLGHRLKRITAFQHRLNAIPKIEDEEPHILSA